MSDKPSRGVAGPPTVVLFRTWILPRSETFIKEQALALRTWRPVLIGEQALDQVPLDGLDVKTVYRQAPSLPQRSYGFALRRLDRPHPTLSRLIGDARPSLIHAHFGYDGVEVWPVAKRLGIPLLITLHGGDITIKDEWFECGQSGWRWRQYPRRLAHVAAQPAVRFIAVSESVKAAAIGKGLPRDRIAVRPIGVDLSRFRTSGPPIAQRAPMVLFVGRLVEKKGCAYLIDAFRAMKTRVPQAALVIAGDGPERRALAARASGCEGISFLGAVSHSRVEALLAEARVLCLPSVTAENGNAEGFGMVLLEAQASGVPVVTSACGGAQEGILDGQTGFAFAERDVSALAASLARLLSDDRLADAFSQAAPRFVRDTFDLVHRTRELERLYDAVVADADPFASPASMNSRQAG